MRCDGVVASLEEQMSTATDMGALSDHLSLLRRWHYRPEKQRAGEVFFPNADGVGRCGGFCGARRGWRWVSLRRWPRRSAIWRNESAERRVGPGQRAGDWPLVAAYTSSSGLAHEGSEDK